MACDRKGRCAGIAALVWLLVSLMPAGAELRRDDLSAPRPVSQGEWLGLRLEVLGQRLSFPAYRVHLEVDEDRRIAFDFLASSALSEHLTEDVEAAVAEEMLVYHARGILEQVDELLQESFPDLWARYDRQRDFHGRFLGPGSEWDEPPRNIAYWRDGRFAWER